MSIYLIICKDFKLIHALKGFGILLSWNFDKNIFYLFSLKSSLFWSFLSTLPFLHQVTEMPHICLKLYLGKMPKW